jgi:regulator of sigma E protease
MEWLTDQAAWIIPFLVVLTVLVFVHELGHYWVARRNGVKVETFSIGFGPELFGWTARSGTRWKVSALPLGGYVKMFGDMDASSRPDDDKNRAMTAEERAVAFPYKSLSAKAWIVAAGPLANFLFAFVLLAGLFLFAGQPTTPAVITEVMEGSAAERAGLLAGDRIVSINGEAVERFEDVQRVVQLNLERPLAIVVDRGGQPVELTAQPTIVTDVDPQGCEVRVARLGIKAEGRENRELGVLESVQVGASETWGIARDTLGALWQIVAGERGTDELGGPIRIAELSGQVAEFGLVSLLWFMAILSVNLGLINLFPIPVLDGGHLLFFACEAVRGRPLGPRAQEYGFKIGIALVLSLMIFATINDLVRITGCV